MMYFDDEERDVTAMGYSEEDDGYGDFMRDDWLAKKDFEKMLEEEKQNKEGND